MSNQVLGVVSIHRLRTGATVQLYLSANKGLYQTVSGSSCLPDWSQSNNQPVITPQLTGATMTEPKWYKDDSNTPLTSGEDYTIGSDGSLRFLKSPVDLNAIHNITYTFKCKVTTGGYTEDIERSIMVLVHEGGDNSYWGHISAPQGTVLGQVIKDGAPSEISFITLSPSLWCGASEKTINDDYTVKWFKTGAGSYNTTKKTYDDLEITGSVADKWDLSGGNLIVKRGGVDSMAHFECRFYDKQGVTMLESEGISVADNADEFFISISGDKNVYTGGKADAVLVAGLYKHGTNESVSATKISEWVAIVTDSERMNEFPASDYSVSKQSDGTCKFTMNEAAMCVPNTGDNHESLGAGSWLKCGDSASEDVAVADKSEATQCDVTVQFIVTVV